MRTKLTLEMIDSVCSALETGSTMRTACSAAGIGKSTYYRWKDKGKASKGGIYRDFWEQTSAALGRARVTLELAAFQTAIGGYEVIETKVLKRDGVDVLTVTTRTMPPDARMLMKILERRYPEEWGAKSKVSFDLSKGEEIVNLFQRNKNAQNH